MSKTLSHQELSKILPHAYPFLLIDRVEDYKEHEYLVATKNITANEWPFTALDHPPSHNHYPETLLIEAAAQAALVLYHISKIKIGERRPKYFLGRTKGEFLKSIISGDKISFLAFANKMMDTGGYSEIEISVKSALVAKVEVIYSVRRDSSIPVS